MKTSLSLILLILSISVFAQKRVNPVIKSNGGVFEIPDATVKPDPALDYKIIVELYKASENSKEVHQDLYNVARLINLHVSGGVPKEKLDIVVVVHGEATYTLTDEKAYQKKYDTSNPNIELYKELSDAGVKLVVCGQSLIGRGVDKATLIPQVRIATSMLTTVTTHQLKGYAFLKF